MSDFDRACETFTLRMRAVADWKHSYFGAAYTTRLMKAVEEARKACDELERRLRELGETPFSPPPHAVEASTHASLPDPDTIRREAFEEAAKVADEYGHKHRMLASKAYHEVGNDDLARGQLARALAAGDVAEAIRQLQASAQEGGNNE